MTQESMSQPAKKEFEYRPLEVMQEVLRGFMNPFPAPDFQRLNTVQRNYEKDYLSFFDLTEEDRVETYARGANLTQLMDLVQKCEYVLSHCNPIADTFAGPIPDESTAIRARQWHFDRLSDIKSRVAQAVASKRRYYLEHWLGRITKLVLQCLFMWNKGDTTAIITAEDFLLRWDSRRPVRFDTTKGYYEDQEFFWPLIKHEWVKQKMDTTHHFNYNPQRNIALVRHLNYTENGVFER